MQQTTRPCRNKVTKPGYASTIVYKRLHTVRTITFFTIFNRTDMRISLYGQFCADNFIVTSVFAYFLQNPRFADFRSHFGSSHFDSRIFWLKGKADNRHKAWTIVINVVGDLQRQGICPPCCFCVSPSKGTTSARPGGYWLQKDAMVPV